MSQLSVLTQFGPSVASKSATSAVRSGCATWATVTTADPEAAPALAVIVAVPLPAAVTRPDASTVATDVSPLLHVTVAPAITLAFWSRTFALS